MIDLSTIPEEPEERRAYVEGKKATYRSIMIKGFKSVLCYPHNTELDKRSFQEWMDGHVIPRIIEPYPKIAEREFDDPVEFSFVYTVRDILNFARKEYDNRFELDEDNTAQRGITNLLVAAYCCSYIMEVNYYFWLGLGRELR